MSTRSMIIIKVKPEHIGKTIKFNAKKLPVKLTGWGSEKVRSKCKPTVLEKPYIGIYCHWDGYPSDVGSTLVDNFADYDTALNLIAGGYCSIVSDGEVRHYANRYGEKWDWIKPMQSDTPPICSSVLYAYVFKNGKWGCAKVEAKKIGKIRAVKEWIDGSEY